MLVVGVCVILENSTVCLKVDDCFCDSLVFAGWLLFLFVGVVWWVSAGFVLARVFSCQGLFRCYGLCFFNGEFDPGSGRTLAACLTHASRAVRPFGVHERRTGE